jgi:hypothetical protein
MNENFRKYETLITKLVRSGHVKFKGILGIKGIKGIMPMS